MTAGSNVVGTRMHADVRNVTYLSAATLCSLTATGTSHQISPGQKVLPLYWLIFKRAWN
jgi:hypothetical protein